ncbi:MAG: hypothetical protein FJ221_05070 [Lentisphaerae bacterium]|nr:hypothetical protein [Lentisphaerota bacterium]
MKTTLEIDEKRLRSVMALTGIKTRRAAVEHSLREAERLARLDRIVAKPWTPEEMAGILDPAYDLAALRAMDKPAAR